jgi:hypothetical protein
MGDHTAQRIAAIHPEEVELLMVSINFLGAKMSLNILES